MKLIPLFPLEIVVFPHESLNLHIFEPRYRQLINDCHNEDILFGIPFYRDSYPLKYGTIVKIELISRTYPDGRLDIKTKGLKPFEVKRYIKKHPGKMYPGGYITNLYWEEDTDMHMMIEIKNKVSELHKYMDIKAPLEPLTRSYLTFEIAHKVGFSKNQEYELLQIISEKARQQYMLDHLNRMIPMVQEAEMMRRKIQLNGHFKHLTPPNI